MTRGISNFVRIVEVGPRDGLQNIKQFIPTEVKKGFLDRLSKTGLQVIEAASFVNPKWVPQMADGSELMKSCIREPGVRYSALTPNEKGFQRAIDAGIDEVAVFTAASEAFNQKNINCSISESLERFKPLMALAREQNIPVRGYVSCVLGCPYDGEVSPIKVAEVTKQLVDMGCYEVSLGDTIGVGTRNGVLDLIRETAGVVPKEKLAVHFHNTYGQALTNIAAAVDEGIRVVDSAAAGLGGCPYAEGASGNVSTEDVLYLLQGMGFKTGVDLDEVIEAGRYITDAAGLPNRSMVAVAELAKQEKR